MKDIIDKQTKESYYNFLEANKKFEDQIIKDLISTYEPLKKLIRSFDKAQEASLKLLIAQIQKIQIPKIEIPKINIDPLVLQRMDFLWTIYKMNWPLFIRSTDELEIKINEVRNNKETIDAQNEIEKLIYDYCGENLIRKIQLYWGKCKNINEERQPILKEAIEMHLNEHYYSSTALLTCQIYGIVNDINDNIKKNGQITTEEDKTYISRLLKIEPKSIDTEKGKLMQLLMVSDEGPLICEMIANYFLKEILCSSESKERWKHQPVRNKICHGIQLNFGTKEHSLKSILAIDILINLSNILS